MQVSTPHQQPRTMIGWTLCHGQMQVQRQVHSLKIKNKIMFSFLICPPNQQDITTYRCFRLTRVQSPRCETDNKVMADDSSGIKSNHGYARESPNPRPRRTHLTWRRWCYVTPVWTTTLPKKYLSRSGAEGQLPVQALNAIMFVQLMQLMIQLQHQQMREMMTKQFVFQQQVLSQQVLSQQEQARLPQKKLKGDSPTLNG